MYIFAGKEQKFPVGYSQNADSVELVGYSQNADSVEEKNSVVESENADAAAENKSEKPSDNLSSLKLNGKTIVNID